MLKHPDIVMESLHSLTGASWNRKLSRNASAVSDAPRVEWQVDSRGVRGASDTAV